MLQNLSYTKWFIITILLLGCVMASCAFAHQAVYIALLINLLTILFSKHEHIWAQLFFMLPFAMVYKAAPSSSSFLTYLLLLYSIKIIAIKEIKLDTLLLLSIYALIGSLLSPLQWVKFVSGFVVLLHFISTSKIDGAKYYVIAFSFGLLLSSVIGLQKTDLPLLSVYYDDFNAEIIGGEIKERFSALYTDPNYFSISIVLAVNLLLSFAMRGEINKYLSTCLVITLTYFGSLTYSKIFMLAISLSFLAQSSSFLKMTKHRVFAIIMLTGVLAFGVSYFLKSTYFDNFLSRIDTNDISNNRFFIWGRYMDYILSDIKVFLLGVGIGGDLYMNVGPHNTYIESLYHLGFVGTILYVITVYGTINSRRIIEHRSIKNYLPLLILLIMIGTLGCLFVVDIWFYYILIWISLNSSDNTNNDGATIEQE